jgi:hypothetical protein
MLDHNHSCLSANVIQTPCLEEPVKSSKIHFTEIPCIVHMAEEVYVSGPTHIVCDTFFSQTNARKNLADEKSKPKSKDPVDIKKQSQKEGRLL